MIRRNLGPTLLASGSRVTLTCCGLAFVLSLGLGSATGFKTAGAGGAPVREPQLEQERVQEQALALAPTPNLYHQLTLISRVS